MNKKKEGRYSFGTGRPPMYRSAEELQKKIEDYFENGLTYKDVIVGPPNNKRIEQIPVPTITGLVLHCGFANRRSFYEYEDKPEFTHTIKRARAFIEREYEELLQTIGGSAIIFALKNFGWKDEQGIRHSGGIAMFVVGSEVDKMLIGYIRVVTGYNERAVRKVSC